MKRGKQKTNYNVYEKADAWDIIHLILCTAVCICAVFVFVNYEKYMNLFPVVFFIAAAMNLVNGIRLLVPSADGKRNVPGFIVFLVMGILLAAVGVAGAIVCW